MTRLAVIGSQRTRTGEHLTPSMNCLALGGEICESDLAKVEPYFLSCDPRHRLKLRSWFRLQARFLRLDGAAHDPGFRQHVHGDLFHRDYFACALVGLRPRMRCVRAARAALAAGKSNTRWTKWRPTPSSLAGPSRWGRQIFRVSYLIWVVTS
jgi:hypothetical protein